MKKLILEEIQELCPLISTIWLEGRQLQYRDAIFRMSEAYIENGNGNLGSVAENALAYLKSLEKNDKFRTGE